MSVKIGMRGFYIIMRAGMKGLTMHMSLPPMKARLVKVKAHKVWMSLRELMLTLGKLPMSWDGSVVFVPTSHSDGRVFEPSTRSQPAHLGEKVDATALYWALTGSPWKILCARFTVRLTFFTCQNSSKILMPFIFFFFFFAHEYLAYCFFH